MILYNFLQLYNSIYVSAYKKWRVDLSKCNMKYMVITERKNEESKKYCGLSIFLTVLSKELNILSMCTDWKTESHYRDSGLMSNNFLSFLFFLKITVSFLPTKLYNQATQGKLLIYRFRQGHPR